MFSGHVYGDILCDYRICESKLLCLFICVLFLLKTLCFNFLKKTDIDKPSTIG
jgi:hypothetical protein